MKLKVSVLWLKFFACLSQIFINLLPAKKIKSSPENEGMSWISDWPDIRQLNRISGTFPARYNVYIYYIYYVLYIYCFRNEVGRQFSEEPLLNYATWGFIAGIMDYFVRYRLDNLFSFLNIS